jgi:hypothetical protein
MQSIKFTESIIIEDNAQNVFDFTQDYNKRLLWDTFLKKADLINGAIKPDKGVKVLCIAKNGIGMETEYVTFKRPNVTAIKMTKGPYMFNSFLGSWSFKTLTENKTEVIFLYSFSLSFPFNLFENFIKNNLQKNVKKRLIDLKCNIENKSTKA